MPVSLKRTAPNRKQRGKRAESERLEVDHDVAAAHDAAARRDAGPRGRLRSRFEFSARQMR
jgi:hypothetical protein